MQYKICMFYTCRSILNVAYRSYVIFYAINSPYLIVYKLFFNYLDIQLDLDVATSYLVSDSNLILNSIGRVCTGENILFYILPFIRINFMKVPSSFFSLSSFTLTELVFFRQAHDRLSHIFFNVFHSPSLFLSLSPCNRNLFFAHLSFSILSAIVYLG